MVGYRLTKIEHRRDAEGKHSALMVSTIAVATLLRTLAIAETVIYCEQSGTQAIAQALTCQFECIRRLLYSRVALEHEVDLD
jgi:hypothetical protein